MIQVEHLTRMITTRTRKTTILDGVTCSIPTGSLFTISGPSGSGNSTLLNRLTGIDRPPTGACFFQAKNYAHKARMHWHVGGQHVGIVFQFFQLMPTLTALENVLLALELGSGAGLKRRQWRERALLCLEQARITDLAHRLPAELSGGEQQRVAIARALTNDPPVIVADEPTGNLDSRTAHQVFQTLADLVQHGKTVIYVTHDPELASRAGQRIELLDGRIVNSKDSQVIVSGPLTNPIVEEQ